MKKIKYLTKTIRCPDGTRKYVRGKTAEELERKVREAQVQLGLGININDDTTVAEFAQTWLIVYKKPAMKPQSFSVLSGNVSRHIIPAIGAKLIRDVRSADCMMVIGNLSGSSRSLQSAVLNAMRALFECAVDNHIIARNPVSKSLQPVAHVAEEREPLTHEQMDALCRKAISHTDKLLGAFILLCGWAGLREGEALGLNWSSIDFDRGTIHVKEQYIGTGVTSSLKTETSNRRVPMPPVLLSFLSGLPEPHTGYLFNVRSRSLKSGYFQKMQRMSSVDKDGLQRVTNAVRSASLDFYVHPHLLRHTYATRCIEGGLDPKTVQYLLGHSTSKVTMDIYAHYQEEERHAETAHKVRSVFTDTPLVVGSGF